MSGTTKIVDYKIYDIAQQIIGSFEEEKGESHVVIVDIDEKSINALGQWPWPRIVLAEAVDKIDSYSPSAIGLDLIFPEKDRTSPSQIISFYKDFFNIVSSITGINLNLQDNDKIFASSLKETQSTLGIYLSSEHISNNNSNIFKSIDIDLAKFDIRESKYMTLNTEVIRNATDNFGFLNATIDEDGILRRMPLFRSYNTQYIPTFSLATLLSIDPDLELTKEKSFEILGHKVKTDKHADVLLNYYSDEWYKKVSLIDVISGNIPQDMLMGKIVLIGSSAVGLHDQVTISGGKRVVGVSIHATLIDNLLGGSLLYQPDSYAYVNVLISLFLSLLFFFLLVKKYNKMILVLFVGALISSMTLYMYQLINGVNISIGYFLFPYHIHFFIIGLAYIVIDTYERKAFSEELNRSHVALLDSMVHVAEVHDIETGAHIIRTKKYIKHLATYMYEKGMYKDELSYETIEMMYRTAPLHDLGKVGIEDAILKKNGRLTALEYEVMKTHADLGKHIINNAISSYKANDFFVMARNIAHYHHEKWDGSGYPEGLSGHDIPLEARFMALSDVYDALVSKRVYKEPFSYERTIDIIVDGKGKHFDPVMVEAFLEIQDEFKSIAENYKDNMYS
ncbi:CHASE2 domain-containing protein [Sulfurimonas aquatica]|uniref:CHASE2 domain-containing protein n=1 Tax=Sulfurimonas aquatica TaxID=2672570 RepID=A0A975B0P8_9BACT|nr:CHASE2 domain-containing protein [Sulfurimonas aquatica]QSZ42094.1 CHASE2 domain-containing protein [Sulfurimonas aquatica]